METEIGRMARALKTDVGPVPTYVEGRVYAVVGSLRYGMQDYLRIVPERGGGPVNAHREDFELLPAESDDAGAVVDFNDGKNLI